MHNFRRRIMIAGNELPYDAEVTYIESTGLQYIDTTVVPDATTVLVVDGSFVSVTSDDVNFGMIDSSGTLKRFHFGVYLSKFIFGVGNSYNMDLSYNTDRHIFTLDGSGIGKLDSTSKSLQTIGNVSLSIFLFARNANGTADTFCNFRLYSCKIYKNGVLVRDFIPVRKGQVGYLYDKVSGQLYGNMGSGSFLIGSDVDTSLYADLGLPSGTLWAKRNVGAALETDYGYYYRYGKGSQQQSTGQNDYTGLENPLSTSADTAYQVWGSEWRIPTETQMQELLNNTYYEGVTIDGVFGGKFTSKVDSSKYIFIPIAGYKDRNGNMNDVGSYGYIWSCTPAGSDTGRARALMFETSGSNTRVITYIRHAGFNVRPVYQP